MTRDEAISKWIIPAINNTWNKNKCKEILEALEQEPCEDIISRKSIKQKLQEHHDFFVNAYGGFSNLPQNDKSRVDEITNCIAMVVNEPSVTPQETRWIPVSEKLPNDRDWYLGIFKESDTGWINPLPFICDYVGRETKATTKEHWILRGFTDRDVRDCDYYFNLECVAWMPLPPCYAQESEDKE